MAEPITRKEMIIILRAIIMVYTSDGLPRGVHDHLKAILAALEAEPEPLAEIEIDGPHLSLKNPADVQAYFATKGLPEQYRLIVLPS